MATTPRPPTVPLDPDSPEGRDLAERLTETLADLRLAIAEREREGAQQGQPKRGAA